MNEIKECPFCGAKPLIEPWHGGARTKHMVYCGNDYCFVGPQVTGETKSEAIERWNTRVNEGE
jgi:hypothetical protein